MKEKHIERTVSPTGAGITKTGVAAWLAARVGRQAGIPAGEIDIQRPFLDYGLRSAAMMDLLEELGQWLGRPLSAALAYDYPNIEALAQHLAQHLAEPSASSRVTGEPARMEPIAIIGLGCRFPKAKNPEEFWQLLRNGVDAMTEVPAARWPATGKALPRGGFIDGVDQFDAAFFGISARELELMDPQQRMMLEVGWEALENAGIDAESLAGSQTGVFVGICHHDYYNHVLPAAGNLYFETGNAFSISANRLSYSLDLRGPSKAIDTACSSALVALHDACISLQRGECDLALAGGVNLMLHPGVTERFVESRLLSPEGRCKTFDAGADGYARGEGCGVVVLKRLRGALEEGDTVLALVRGSAINQDGRGNGLTAPNGPAQQAVIRQALANAGVAAEEISYVETHGIGTPLGDPIEFNALKAVLMPNRAPNENCHVGSVKTNIGHLEAAAGIAGVIKTVLALQHREIPPHLHLEELNPHLDIWDSPISIPTAPAPWPNERRLAGVSSFGFGGANAHVILEQAPAVASASEVMEKEAGAARPFHLLTLSAKSREALGELAKSHATYLAAHPDVPFADICFTANTGRAHFEHRIALVAESSEAARGRLDAADYATGEVNGQIGKTRGKIAFLFTGQGSEYPGMGRQLYETCPLFRETIDRCDAILRPWDVPILDLLYPASPNPKMALSTDMSYLQPSLFALEYALARLWQSWGLTPDVVMGHGVGEYVAACVAGVFSLDDALKLVASRGCLMQTCPEGRMLDRFAEVAGRITYANPGIPLCSNVTGEMATEEITTAEYWVRHLREPVRFAASVKTLYEQGFDTFIEIGPKPALLGMARQCLPDGAQEGCAWLPSLREGHEGEQSDWQQLLHSLSELYARGHAVDWTGFHKAPGNKPTRRKVSLPTYPFQRKRYWVDAARLARLAAHDQPGHPLLGRRLQLSVTDNVYFENRIDLSSTPWLADHRIFDVPVFPTNAYMEMVLAAGAELLTSSRQGLPGPSARDGNISIKNVAIEQALILPEEEATRVQAVLSPEEGGYRFQLLSLNKKRQWTVHITGQLMLHREAVRQPEALDLDLLRAQCPTEMPVAEYYQACGGRGIHYGPDFQGIKRIFRGERLTLVEAELPESVTGRMGAGEMDAYRLHPALFDAALQASISTLSDTPEATYLPIGIKGLQVYRHGGTRVWSLIRTVESDGQTVTADASLFDGEGAVIAQLEGFVLARVGDGVLRRHFRKKTDDLYELDWEARGLAKTDARADKTPGSWLIFADGGGMGRELAGRLAEAGNECILVYAQNTEISPRCRGQAKFDVLQIDPENPSAFQRLFTEALPSGTPPLEGIVHLWSLDAPDAQELTSEKLLDAQILGCGSVLHLLQALSKQGLPAKLWLVTRNAVAVVQDPDALDAAQTCAAFAQAPLWGLGKVIALEHPGLWGGIIDNPETADLLAEMLAGMGAEDPKKEDPKKEDPKKEDQVAYRDGRRHVLRLAESRISLSDEDQAPRQPPLQPNYSYLITGGLGSLGLAVARWMVDEGARHLVLTGRRAPSEAARAAIKQLEESGAEVRVIGADVSDFKQVSHLLEDVAHNMPPLKGIIHAAGILDTKVLADQDWENFRQDMTAKVEGSWNLHTLSQAMALDFFICFSSFSSLLGGRALGSYVAANTFMDALIHCRRALGLPGLAINWGAWAGDGMWAKLVGARSDEMDEYSMSPERATQILGALMRKPEAVQVGVLPGDLSAYLQKMYPGPIPAFLERYGPAMPEASPSAAFIERLKDTPPEDRRDCLAGHIQEELNAVLGSNPARFIDPARRFMELGMDSLMTLEFRNRLQTSLKCQLPSDLSFKYPTLDTLTDFIAGQLEPARAGVHARTAPTLEALPRQGREPLSIAQQELWPIINQSEAYNRTYTISLTLRIRGKLHRGILRAALDEIVRRHETLRTVFHEIGGQPSQVILSRPIFPFSITEEQYVPATEAEWDRELLRLTAEEAEKPLDLSTGPLARASLREIGPDDQALLIILHHFIADIWSMRIFKRELALLYNAFLEKRPSPLPEPEVQYADFAHWQQRSLTRAQSDARLEYWEKWLSVEPPPLALPTDRPRPAVETGLCSSQPFHLSPELTRKLAVLGRQSDVTLFMTMMAAFAIVIHRWSGENEIVVGAPFANRNHKKLEPLIGWFAQALSIRLEFQGNPDFPDVLAQVREANLSALANQDISPSYFIKTLQPKRDFRARPLYRVLLNLVPDNLTQPFRLGDSTVTPFGFDSRIRPDLLLNFREEKNGPQTTIEGMWRYKTELFDGQTIARVARDFQNLLEAVAADPEQSLDALFPVLCGRK